MDMMSKQSSDKMRDVIIKAKPGDKLKILFAEVDLDKPGNLAHLNSIIEMCIPNGRAIDIGPTFVDSLLSVIEYKRWAPHVKIQTAEVLIGFNAEDFISHTIECGMLESIELLKQNLKPV